MSGDIVTQVRDRLAQLIADGWPADVGKPTESARIEAAIERFSLEPGPELRQVWSSFGYIHQSGFSLPGFFPDGCDPGGSAGDLETVHRLLGNKLPKGSCVVGVDEEDWQVPEQSTVYILSDGIVRAFDVASGKKSYLVGSFREYLMSEVLLAP